MTALGSEGALLPRDAESPVFQEVLLTGQNVRSQWSAAAFLLIADNWQPFPGNLAGRPSQGRPEIQTHRTA